MGIGHRTELSHALLEAAGEIDFVEIVAEACRGGAARREAQALAEIWPVVPHGVKLSLGSADGLDEARVRDFARLARDVKAPLVSEHVSFTRAGSREIGHLTELPMTREAIAVVARNVATLRRALPDVPLLLENVARAFVWNDEAHELDEGAFHAAVAEATGCDLLLDVGNLYANAVNAGRDPSAVLASYPLERVAMLHVAGGVLEHGFYFDTHAHPIPEPVFALVAEVLAQRDVPVLLERDADYGAYEAILGEARRLRSLGGRGAPVVPRQRPVIEVAGSASEAFTAAQDALAEQLVAEHVQGASEAVLRARGVLERKRADDALPLLPELSRRLAASEALRLGKIAGAPRPPSLTAVADALRIAAGARTVPELARSATRDALLLEARFVGGTAGPRPRTLPFVGRADLPADRADEGTIWAWKGFGPGAAVRLIERGAKR